MVQSSKFIAMLHTVIAVVIFVALLLLVGMRFIRVIREMLGNPELRLLLVVVGSLLVAGTVFYHGVEKWSWLDSLYFSVVTLTTVGYGDLSPQTVAGKIFTMVYLVGGLGVLAAFITTVANVTIQYEKDRRTKTPSNE